MIEKEIFSRNNTFCMLPWTHIHVSTNGDIFPCCYSTWPANSTQPNEPLGKLKESSIENIWNSNRMRQLRVDMLNGNKNKYCTKCYEQEKAGFKSHRQVANDSFRNKKEFVKTTNKTGKVDDLNILFLDIRLSNLCNLRCRTCGPSSSTAWYQDLHKNDPRAQKVLKPTESDEETWRQIEPLLCNIEKIYFAGGEPLLIGLHYKILEKLIELKKTNVTLIYNTNLMQLSRGVKNVLHLWPYFKKIVVGASLDGSRARGEYIRKGLKWDTAVSNGIILKNRCENLSFHINFTLSIFNILHLPKFHKEVVELDLINVDELKINILQGPPWYRISTLPLDWRKKAEKNIRNHIKYFINNFDNHKNIENQFQSIIDFLNQNDTSEYLDEFIRRTKDLDKLRNESFKGIFPELANLLNR